MLCTADINSRSSSTFRQTVMLPNRRVVSLRGLQYSTPRRRLGQDTTTRTLHVLSLIFSLCYDEHTPPSRGVHAYPFSSRI